ncbi:MAG: hypothetical protein ACLS69_03175 [Butyricicoccus sp.]
MLGQGEYALEEARVLLPVAQSVTLLTDGSEAPADCRTVCAWKRVR